MEGADSLLVNGRVSTLQLALLISLPVSSFGWPIIQGTVWQLSSWQRKGTKAVNEQFCSLRAKAWVPATSVGSVPDQHPSPSWGSWHWLQVWAEDDENTGGVYHSKAGLGVVSLNIDSTSVLQGGPRKSWSPKGQSTSASASFCSTLQPPCHLGAYSVLWGFIFPQIHKE